MTTYTPQMRSPVESTVCRFLDKVQSLIPIKDDDLTREFLLYGFVEATGHLFETESGKNYYGSIAEPMRFNFNDGVLAFSDADGYISVRGISGRSKFLLNMLHQQGYVHDSCFPVPISNNDYFADKRLIALFALQDIFASTIVSNRLGYGSRETEMPEIRVEGSFIVPGSLENRLLLEPQYHIPSSEVPS